MAAYILCPAVGDAPHTISAVLHTGDSVCTAHPTRLAEWGNAVSVDDGQGQGEYRLVADEDVRSQPERRQTDKAKAPESDENHRYLGPVQDPKTNGVVEKTCKRNRKVQQHFSASSNCARWR